MQMYLDCYPCFLRQGLEAARFTNMPLSAQRELMHRIMTQLAAAGEQATPPQMAQQVHAMVRAHSGQADPYAAAKAESTEHALTLYPYLQEQVAAAEDPLATAVRLSIAGNIIDLGIAVTYDLEASVQRVLNEPLTIDDIEALRARLAAAERVLYLGDNCGETVFDRVLIETLNRPVTYAVRGQPVLNDATRDDAVAAGLDQVATIIDNGDDTPGTVLERCSSAFQEQFRQAELIIAKGQGNYESLSGVDAPIIFLLQAKCPVIAANLGVPTRALIAQASRLVASPA